MSKPPFQEIRRLRHEVDEASDQQICRLVDYIDTLADRGDIDGLLDPLRPRLAQIRPSRPLTLQRLLFMPLDPLIVPASKWDRTAITLPRSVLAPMADAAFSGLPGPVVIEWQRRLENQRSCDADVVIEVGASAWPAAAAVLRTSAVPTNWANSTGLSPDKFPALATPIAALLDNGLTLYRLSQQDEEIARPDIAAALLQSANQSGGPALAMMLALLLAVWAQPAELLKLSEAAIENLPVAERALPGRVVDCMLDTVLAPGPAGAPATPDMVTVRRMAVLVDGLQDPRSPRSAKLQQVKQRLDAICRQKFDTVADVLIRPGLTLAEQGSGAEPLADGEVIAMETAARELRRIVAVGRRMTATNHYEITLRKVAGEIQATAGLNRIDRMRLAEILLGPDAAEAFR